jgi:hypothetical protein
LVEQQELPVERLPVERLPLVQVRRLGLAPQARL